MNTEVQDSLDVLIKSIHAADPTQQDVLIMDLYNQALKIRDQWAISQMQPEWVPVEDRLPKRGADVYFYRLGTSEYVYEGQYIGNGFFEQGNIRYDETVTHFIEKFKPQPPTT